MLSFCFILGIFDGCFITMLGPIAFDICGPAGAGQAIGFLLAMCSIPLTIGPPVAGAIYDKVGDYSGAFLAAGIPPIVGAVVMLTIRCFPPEDQGISVILNMLENILYLLDNKLSEKKAKYLPQSETKHSLVEKI